MSLDLDPIRKRLLALRLDFGGPADERPGEAVFVANAPRDVARLLDEVEERRADIETMVGIVADMRQQNARLRAEIETLRSEIAPWQTLAEKLGRQNDNMLSEVARLSRDHVATHEENASLDANLKDCVNFMRDLWPVIGVDLNALRLESDRAAAIETVRRAVEDWGTDD